MTEDFINCGERTVQILHRIALQDICRAHGIKPGDNVEVWIKKTERNGYADERDLPEVTGYSRMWLHKPSRTCTEMK